MALELTTAQPEFERTFQALLASRDDNVADVRDAVQDIIRRVRAEGDKAVLDYTNRFDRRTLESASALRITPDIAQAAYERLDATVRGALELARDRVERYHRRQMPEREHRYEETDGTQLGWLWRPLDSVGLYVPGGTASYPSSVIMNAVPARVAGVERIIMVVPAPDGQLNDAVLAAAHLCGIEAIYTVGGAQAVAALAFGTETIPATDKIVGPGNAYVAEAKRQLYGQVGIDAVAGPTDVTIIADDSANPAWIAADLLAQAEHDPTSRAVLLSTSSGLIASVAKEVARILPTLPRQVIARQSWEEKGALIHTQTLEEAAALANRLAPEHLEILTDAPEALLPHIRHAGAIFLGHYAPEALGDYVAGPSHVLPTQGNARFSSGLSVYDFLKKSSLIGATKAAFQTLCDAGAALAGAEGLHAHALSLTIRRGG